MKDPRILDDPDLERRIQDAAHVLLDLCHGVPGPAAAHDQAHAVSMAVQAIFITDHYRPGQPIAERRSAVCSREVGANVRGLGLGVGACLGSVVEPAAACAMRDLYTRALIQGFERKAAAIRHLAGGRKG